jgi:hypothetical protein
MMVWHRVYQPKVIASFQIHQVYLESPPVKYTLLSRTQVYSFFLVLSAYCLYCQENHSFVTNYDTDVIYLFRIYSKLKCNLKTCFRFQEFM